MIHLRWIPVDHSASLEEPSLSASERARAERMKHPRSKATFITARRELRREVGARLNIAPGDIELRIRDDGKPEVDGLFMNLSHSAEWILLGMTTLGEIGVDVEWKDPRRARAALAERFFSDAEQVRLAKRPEDFEQLWTAKEAVLKATGQGIRVRLHGVDTSAVCESWCREESTGAVVRSVEAPADYAAAVGFLDATDVVC